MIYHFVVQYFGLGKEERPPLALPAPPTQIEVDDEFGQAIAAAHRSLTAKQQRIVRELLPRVLRLGSCNKAPKDWRPFWRALNCSEEDRDFRFVVRLWYSIAGAYALRDEEGSWHFVSPSYTNLSAIRGMCWLSEEVYG